MPDMLGYRLVIVSDLVHRTTGNLTKKLVSDTKEVYEEVPDECPHCNYDVIVGVEIMGACSGTLLWECEECSEMFLKYDIKKTEKELQKAKECWTNCRDWGYVPRRKFN